jgi:DNA topoisomerase VI subunit B
MEPTDGEQHHHISYFKNNFALFGFGDQEKAFFQCFRETIENSIDACQENAAAIVVAPSGSSDATSSNVKAVTEHKQRHHQVGISITASSHHGTTTNNKSNSDGTTITNVVLLSVTDNGCGMNNAADLLSCFRSTKVASDKNSTNDVGAAVGRFGVGLSICLLYCIQQTQQQYITITSKTIHQTDVAIAKFSVDDTTGSPTAIQQLSCAAPGFLCGTKITMPIAVSSLDDFQIRRGE